MRPSRRSATGGTTDESFWKPRTLTAWTFPLRKAVRSVIDHFRFDKGAISRKPSRYYLAYGSNLDMERMGHRCPYAVPVGVTEIYGYRLLFKKSKTGCYATIEQDANESVPAVVWLLSEFDELLLDRYEGCPRYYYKKQFQLPVWNLDGHRMKKLKTCMAYILHEERQLGCPSHEVLRLAGRRVYGVGIPDRYTAQRAVFQHRKGGSGGVSQRNRLSTILPIL